MTKIRKESTTIDYILRATWISIQKMFNEKAITFGATMSSAFTLLSIDPKTGTPSSSLGPKMGIAPTSLSRMLNELENRKLITRTSNSEDKRSVIIKLTKEGLRMRDIAKEYVINFHDTVNSEVSQEKLSVFYEVISQINEITTKKKEELKNEKAH